MLLRRARQESVAKSVHLPIACGRFSSNIILQEAIWTTNSSPSVQPYLRKDRSPCFLRLLVRGPALYQRAGFFFLRRACYTLPNYSPAQGPCTT